MHARRDRERRHGGMASLRRVYGVARRGHTVSPCYAAAFGSPVVAIGSVGNRDGPFRYPVMLNEVWDAALISLEWAGNLQVKF